MYLCVWARGVELAVREGAYERQVLSGSVSNNRTAKIDTSMLLKI